MITVPTHTKQSLAGEVSEHCFDPILADVVRKNTKFAILRTPYVLFTREKLQSCTLVNLNTIHVAISQLYVFSACDKYWNILLIIIALHSICCIKYIYQFWFIFFLLQVSKTKQKNLIEFVTFNLNNYLFASYNTHIL